MTRRLAWIALSTAACFAATAGMAQPAARSDTRLDVAQTSSSVDVETGASDSGIDVGTGDRIRTMTNADETLRTVAGIVAGIGSGEADGIADLALPDSIDAGQVHAVNIDDTLSPDNQGLLAGMLAANPAGVRELRTMVADAARLSAALERMDIASDSVVGIVTNENGVIDVYYSELLDTMSCWSASPEGQPASREMAASASDIYVIAVTDCAEITRADFSGTLLALDDNAKLRSALESRGFAPADVVAITSPGEDAAAVYVEIPANPFAPRSQ